MDKMRLEPQISSKCNVTSLICTGSQKQKGLLQLERLSFFQLLICSFSYLFDLSLNLVKMSVGFAAKNYFMLMRLSYVANKVTLAEVNLMQLCL